MFPIATFAVSLVFLQAQFGVNASPAPISLNFGTNFFGSDGLWSAAQIRVGTPEQYLWVYPSTVSAETWVIGPGGCDGELACEQARGGLFNNSASSTYEAIGRYDLTYNRLGLRENYGDYGFDNISLSDTISAPSQPVAVVTDPETWLGQVGLNVRETRFENQTNHLGLISTLVQNESSIPSHSYGYTAGAHYALKGVPGSLVLGGVDTSRYTPNNVNFTLGSDYLPVVAIQSITVRSAQSQGLVALPPNWNSSPVTLMEPSQAAFFTIDTSTPFLWLPPTVCDNFANALNLTYNSTLDLYMFTNSTNNTSGPQVLRDWGLSFVFTLANSATSTSQVQLPISYDAFDLQLSYGFPGLTLEYKDPAISYFPLRRANSSSQYTIGRAFLQETYLTVDYERRSFSVSPVVFADTNVIQPNIVPITRPLESSWPGPQSNNNSLSAGAKAGIGVGVAIVVVILIGLAFFYSQRRKKASSPNEKGTTKKKWKIAGLSNRSAASKTQVSELIGDRRHPRELLADSSNTRFELPANNPIEMPADEVPEVFLAANRTSDEDVASVHDPSLTNEQENADGSSIRKDYNIRATVVERSSSPAPPYSPSEIGRNTDNGSGGVSPYDSRGSGGFNSHTSSGAAISPITQFGTHTRSDGDTSPVSPNTRESRTMSSNGISSGTRGSTQSAALNVPSNRISRTASRNSRFREELIEERGRVSDSQGDHPQLRPRFSWEE